MRRISWRMATMDLPFTHVSEAMDVNTSPLSEMQILTEVGFIKKSKAAGPDGRASSFYEVGSNVAALE